MGHAEPIQKLSMEVKMVLISDSLMQVLTATEFISQTIPNTQVTMHGLFLMAMEDNSKCSAAWFCRENQFKWLVDNTVYPLLRTAARQKDMTASTMDRADTQSFMTIRSAILATL